MTDTVAIALVGLAVAAIAGVPPTLIAIAALRQSKKSVELQEVAAVKLDTNTAKTEETAKKADTLIKKAAVIEHATNGNYSLMAAELRELRLKAEATQRMMDQLLADKREQQAIAERLADKAASRDIEV